MATVKVLLTGATGFLGGTILTEMFTNPHTLFHSGRQLQNYAIVVKCLVRSENTAKKPKAAYATTRTEVDMSSIVTVSLDVTIGTLDSTHLLETLAAEADVIIQCADCDHAAGIHALLDGLRDASLDLKRLTPNGKPVLLHISGAGNAVDPIVSMGASAPVIVSDKLDGDTPPLALPKERSHAELEQSLAEKADRQNSQLVILSPAGIHGQGTGRVGKQETYPALWYEAIIDNGASFVVDKGKNIMNFSSVRDVAGAVLWVLGEILVSGRRSREDCRVEWGTRGYYYIESFEVSAMERATEIGKRLAAENKLPTNKVQKLSLQQVESQYGPWVARIAGVSMRCRADRLRALGWQPRDMDWKLMAKEGTGGRV